ncbi:hypothetical protein ACIPMZ_21245 [Scandinavium goeteborgense]|uniref:hypothetical protein n=1 Tax=Scandinavium goeteborgense TaxID=1851514 RepID=UPI00380A3CF5
MAKPLKTVSPSTFYNAGANSDNAHKKTLVAVEISEVQNAFLTESAFKHGRSKRKELANILEIYRIMAQNEKLDQRLINM